MRIAMLVVPIALVLGLASFATTPASAGTVIGIGMFGGVAVPTGGEWDKDGVKESDNGPYMGAKIPMSFGKISLEPYMSRIVGREKDAYGEDPTNLVRDGYDVMSYGANLALGKLVSNQKGFRPAVFAGGGMNIARRESGPNDDQFGWQAGINLGMNSSETVSWDLRGAYNSISALEGEDDARNYYQFSLGITCVLTR